MNSDNQLTLGGGEIFHQGHARWGNAHGSCPGLDMVAIDSEFLITVSQFVQRCRNELSHLLSVAEQKPRHAMPVHSTADTQSLVC